MPRSKPLHPKAQTTWRMVIWIIVNLGLQAYPIYYLYTHKVSKEKVAEYVNCTLVLVIALGMLFAAISDAITEKCRALNLVHWAFVGLFLTASVVTLRQTLYAEFVQGGHPDEATFQTAMLFGACVGVCGLITKGLIWHEGAVARNKVMLEKAQDGGA